MHIVQIHVHTKCVFNKITLQHYTKIVRERYDVMLFHTDINTKPHTKMSFLPRYDALLLSMIFSDRFRVSNLVLPWTTLITSSNPSGCSPHFLRFSFFRAVFPFNIIPV